MEKKYIIGGLAILGAIGVITYLNKPKKNSEGFFNAVGSGVNDTKPNFAFFANANGICTLYVSGINPNKTRAYYKASSNTTDTYKLIPIKASEYFVAKEMPKCILKNN